MILNSTTDSLQVVLSSTTVTNAFDIVSSYNVITSSGITPFKTTTTVNNLTPVDIISSPSVNEQNQLRFCSIFNKDTTGSTATIHFNDNGTKRVIFSASLFPGDSIQYNPNNGWQTYNYNGLLKVGGVSQNPTSIRMLEYFNAINATTVLTVTSGTDFAFYLGKADRSYNQVSVQWQVTTAIGATITYAEMAIYKGIPLIGSGFTGSRCGWRDCSGANQSGFGSTGVKTTPIQVTGITAGDDIWVVFGTVTSGTNAIIRAGVVDDIGAGFIQTATGSLRPSTNASITFTKQTAQNNAWVAWQGFQW